MILANYLSSHMAETIITGLLTHNDFNEITCVRGVWDEALREMARARARAFKWGPDAYINR